MASRNTQVKARKDLNGDEISLSHSQTDTPLIDVQSLAKLHEFRPDAVDFVLNQTKEEAEHRRKSESKMITYTFIERMGGLVLACLICISGIGGSIYAAIHGYEKLGIAIATVTIGSLAVAFLKRK